MSKHILWVYKGIQDMTYVFICLGLCVYITIIAIITYLIPLQSRNIIRLPSISSYSICPGLKKNT